MMRSLLVLAVIALVVLALVYAALRYMTGVPGVAHRGPLPPLTDEEAALAVALQPHVATIAAREHNIAHSPRSRRSAASRPPRCPASTGRTTGRSRSSASRLSSSPTPRCSAIPTITCRAIRPTRSIPRCSRGIVKGIECVIREFVATGHEVTPR
jgi:hypothetical protein